MFTQNISDMASAVDSDEEGVSLGTEEDDFSVDEELAELENRAVSCLRGTVIAVLLSSALLTSFLVHKATSNTNNINNFQQAFDDDSQELLNNFQQSLSRTLLALDSLALDLESFAETTDSRWPTVTLPDFERRASNALDLADSVPQSVMFVPFLVEKDEHEYSVQSSVVKTWENYSIHHQDWLTAAEEGVIFISDVTHEHSITSRRKRRLGGSSGSVRESISERIFNETGPCDIGNGPFAPLWQTSPIVPGLVEWVNFDLFSLPMFKSGLSAVRDSHKAVLGEVSNIQPYSSASASILELGPLHPFLSLLLGDKDSVDPISPMLYPLFNKENKNDSENSNKETELVGVVAAMISWRKLFSVPLNTKGVVTVLHNNCGQTYSFGISGGRSAGGVDSRFLGIGDLHDVKYSDMNRTIVVGSASYTTTNETMAETTGKMFRGSELDPEYCAYSLSVYPSQAMHDAYAAVSPITYTVAVALIFLLASAVFVFYDFLVERRQKIVMNRALQSTAIVSSLFPEAVRDRLFRRGSVSEQGGCDDCSFTNVDETPPFDNAPLTPFPFVQPAKMRLKTFLTESEEIGANGNAKPIADLFPHCTVLFADISGFTAWSSLRDPTQVFTLLESVYAAFDRIARRRGVFKVETIGDSYVAVTGLPEPQGLEEHAVIMCRFARDCRSRMMEVTRKLESTLGPDTGDLRLRFGLHSGPVTAGVLRGEKSRFQLFGDTVNTAARMESTGERDKIQLSQATADLLREAGKGHWLAKRDKTVQAKGKGEMQTYWLECNSRRNSTGENSRCSISSIDSIEKSDQGNLNNSAIWGTSEEIPAVLTQRSIHQRLIDYNTDLLGQLLKHVVARRRMLEMAGRRCSQGGLPPNMEFHAGKVEQGMVLEEVTEVIKLPGFNSRAFKGHIDPESIELGPAVEGQLKRFVTIIAAMYRNNPFHNFEHASHVTMSVNKLLRRVVAPDITFKRRSLEMTDKSFKKQVASDLHAYTYGITSDPLTQFAVVFSALIHDVDHWGVSNAQLVKEGVPIAEKYKNKSVAEQNSVDLAWDLLMDEDEYGELQKCIFPTDAEFKRFRQVVVNVVMATDIFDKELGELRKNRWDKAFAEKKNGVKQDIDDENRRATIVIEHIMQASDVAHTMQHWHVYQKWNRRLFDELNTAYRAGRMESDPTTFWYKGELGFFDSYVIPLAKKLKKSGVFGVLSDECLNYAIDNRKEWEAKGEMIVAELASNYQQREKEESEARETQAETSTRKKRSRFSRRRSLITTGG